MSREWKPGDVALVTGPARFVDEPGDMATLRALRWVDCWYTGRGRGWTDREAVVVQPLVIINPDDRGQMTRLLDAVSKHGMTRTALRSLLDPPKPAEPQGRYAVVLDADNVEWLRSREGIWSYSRTEGVNTRWVTKSWADIAAVKVLSEGVTA